MNKLKPYLFSIYILSLGLTLASCASSGLQSQLAFGIKAAQQDLWDEAIFRWKKVVESHPNSAAAHNNLAVAYEKKGLWEEAKKEYELALKLDPNNHYIQANYNKFQTSLSLEKNPAFDAGEKKDGQDKKK
ncbi:MAG TPA: tetratricopeptide repeat protein [Candidatus Aminicenantes bacterium]|nr:tetratricopeptide repeat protein [Candidatus Aminicenantes bacterium]